MATTEVTEGHRGPEGVQEPISAGKTGQNPPQDGFPGCYRRSHSSISRFRESQGLSLGCQGCFQLRSLNRRAGRLNSTDVSRNSRVVSLNSMTASSDFPAVSGGFLSVRSMMLIIRLSFSQDLRNPRSGERSYDAWCRRIRQNAGSLQQPGFPELTSLSSSASQASSCSRSPGSASPNRHTFPV